MRVLCAPDSFKESISSVDAARALARGLGRGGHETDLCPMADGGEGTLDALLGGSLSLTVHSCRVTGPDGAPTTARFGILDAAALDRARSSGSTHSPGPIGVVELAEAAGLALVPPRRRDPTNTTTFGVGEAIRAALDAGAASVIIAVGGSATCDGGAGLAQALGAGFQDADGRELPPPLRGGDLVRVHAVSPAPALDAPLRVACDVTNPLLGPHGAAAVYGPQKGATPEQVTRLEAGLAAFARCAGGEPNAPGAGASGGVAYGLAALFGAELVRGADLVLDLVGFDARARGADLVITGEGRLDGQSADGKTCTTVARRARDVGVETVAIVGARGEGWERCVAPLGPVARVISLAERFGERGAAEPAECLERVGEEAWGRGG